MLRCNFLFTKCKLFALQKNTVISPDFLVWKLYENCAFPQNFHIRKLCEITENYVKLRKTSQCWIWLQKLIMKNVRPLSDVRCQKSKYNIIKCLKLRSFPAQGSLHFSQFFAFFCEIICVPDGRLSSICKN